MSTKRRKKAHVVAVMLCLLCAAGCKGGNVGTVETGQQAHTMRQGLSRVNYLLFLPRAYSQDPDKQWPLMVFLHGIAKRGRTLADLDLLKKDGPPMIVEEQLDFPFIVLSPQCPPDSEWEPQLGKLEKLVDEVASTYAVDSDRIILTGLSLGGYGAWHWALESPDRFAALVPIAGGHVHGSDEVPDNICAIKDLPIWAFHGASDDVVSPRQSEVLVEALRACGSDVQLTLYPGAAHDTSWKLAYADQDLYEWMLQQRR